MTMIEKVAQWLTHQGYPLELRTAAALRDLGASFDHGRVYEDPETGKRREIDLMGYLNTRPVSVQFIFECKHADKPWIAFCTDQHIRTEEGYVAARAMTADTLNRVKPIASRQEVQNLAMFRRPDLEGFSLVKAFNDNQDAAHHAMNTVVNASIALTRTHTSYGHANLYLPTIVVDSPILRCWQSDDSLTPTIEEVGIASLLLPIGDGDRVPLHIVHIDHLPMWLSEVIADAIRLNDWMGT